MNLRAATPGDLALLRRWDEQPHVVASDPNDDWEWDTALGSNPDWREQLISISGSAMRPTWEGATAPK